ncbi:MAG: oligosaccharide flippase family protein [Burkholderiales bacterium]|nr:oligosaccharide flippase family protein [Burkholderiales bacterium]
MSRLGLNVLANFAGQFWSALMGVLFIPIYIHLMGIETFGLVGFFVTLQALAMVFDLGLAGTVNRELARRGAAEGSCVRDLVRTLEWIYWPIGALVGICVWACAGLLAETWLRPVSLHVRHVEFSIGLMGAAIAAQWPSAFYAAGLNGLQRQVLSNGLLAVFGTLRGAGVLLPLVFIAPTVEVFFIWQAICALAQSCTLASALWRSLPSSAPGKPRFSGAELAGIGAFTVSLTFIAALSFILVQADKILLSRLLPLDRFGVYVLAASAAAALARLVQPWFNSLYPRFVELHAAGDDAGLRVAYHWGSQWLAIIVLPVASVAVVFAEDLLLLWTRNTSLAGEAAPLLALLVTGSALNGLMNLPYAMQLAHGWTALALWSNVLAVGFSLPAIWWLTTQFDAAGAASVWIAINFGYVLLALPVMHRRILRGELMRWYLADVGPPAVASALSALVIRLLAAPVPDGWPTAAVLACAWLISAAAALTTCPERRRELRGWASRLLVRARA